MAQHMAGDSQLTSMNTEWTDSYVIAAGEASQGHLLTNMCATKGLMEKCLKGCFA